MRRAIDVAAPIQLAAEAYVYIFAAHLAPADAVESELGSGL